MTTKRVPLVEGEIYHVFNRTVAKEKIFNEKRYCTQALSLINYYRFPQRMRFSKYKLLEPELKKAYWQSIISNSELIDIYAFSLMPNHYHFVVYQKNNKGINTFIGNFQNSFAKYFNILTFRTGSVFQDRFKAKRITSEPELKHVIRYIHLNPVTAGLIKLEQLETTAITSHIAYIQKYKIPFIKKDILKQYFSSIDSYKKFIADNEDYQKKLHKIKKLLFD